MIETTVAIAVGFIIDLFLGDPYSIPHPVVFIGKLISLCEKAVRKIFPESDRGLFIGGIFICIAVMSVSTAVPIVILYLAGKISIYLKFIIECIMCWQIIAVKSLKRESMKVYNELENGTIESARKAVSMIVGRDTQSLTDEGVTKAAVETVAENTSDGITAPLFFMLIGGPVLGFLYKSVNTMDSMIGYKNDKYMFLGRAAAKTDDVFNFIPARIGAVVMIVSAFILGYDYKNAVKVFKRDRFNHKSPNSAQTESVCAGALDVCLAGDAYYFGKLVKKDTIGDGIKKIEHIDIIRVNRMMYVSSVITVLAVILIRTAVVLF